MRKSKLFLLSLSFILCLGLLTGCSGEEEGTPPKVSIDGMEIIVGQTVAGEVFDQGFVPYLITQPMNSYMLDGKTWVSSAFTLVPTAEHESGERTTQYPAVHLVNNSDKSANVKDCTIWKVSAFLEDTNGSNREYKGMLINGIDFTGYTRAQAQEAMAGIEETTAEDNKFFITFQDGNYVYMFDFEDYGEVDRIVEAEVYHVFDKSYSEKE